MKTEAKKYLNRPIGENEEELLNDIWTSLPSPSDDDNMLEQGYRNVEQRIRRRKSVRRVYWMSSCAAAVACLFVILLFRGTMQPETPVSTQLDNLGVAVSRQEVQLIIGDSMITNLNNSAKINIDNQSNIALRSSDGKRIALDVEKALKIYVPSGKHFNLELADGTCIVLNSDTWFEYPSSFEGKDERRVKINGEGFFEVKQDTTKPFYVEIPGGESIRVLGTSFNISAYEDNESNITTLLTGKIAYHVSTSDTTIMLLPNQQVCINKKTKHINKNKVDASEYAMWKEGIIYFNDEELRVLAKRLERMYGIEIEVSDKYNDSRFSGMIRYERGIDYITKLLTTTSNITCRVENGIIYLK